MVSRIELKLHPLKMTQIALKRNRDRLLGDPRVDRVAYRVPAKGSYRHCELDLACEWDWPVCYRNSIGR